MGVKQPNPAPEPKPWTGTGQRPTSPPPPPVKSEKSEATKDASGSDLSDLVWSSALYFPWM